MITRAELLSILRGHIKKGKFTLASGKKSDYYLDCRPALMRGDIIQAITKQVEWLIPLRNPRKHQICFAGIGFAGYCLVSAMLSAWGDNARGIVFRTDKKDHGIAKQLVASTNLDNPIVFLDDVATTGGSILKLKEILDNHKDDPSEIRTQNYVGVITLIDREEGAKQNMKKQGLHFDSIFKISELL